AGVTGTVYAIHESRDGTLWAGGWQEMWHNDGSSWQSVAGVTGTVYAIHESRDGILWAGGWQELWRNDGSGWQSVAGDTGTVIAIHESRDGTLWAGGTNRLWRYDSISGQAKNTELDPLLKSVNCSCGCSKLTIYACPCPLAQEVKAGFEEQLALGKTGEQIRAEELALRGSQFDAMID
ncbi:MAG: hypothetical protein QF569_29680, partial [Candidatus Poribacteria bacterium]|nr:hypothetical protein [Candidatus Poribacteria bacterium]